MLIALSTGLVRALKREISILYPDVKSSILTEALARGLGFETHAVMLSRIPQSTYSPVLGFFAGAGRPSIVDDTAFLRYLASKGVPVPLDAQTSENRLTNTQKHRIAQVMEHLSVLRQGMPIPTGQEAIETVYSGQHPTSAAERPMLQAVLRVDMGMSAIAESQGEALLCRVAMSAFMRQELRDTLPINPVFQFEEPIGPHVGIRLKGYWVGRDGQWEPNPYNRPSFINSMSGLSGRLAQGYVDRDLASLCKVASMLPKLSDEPQPLAYDDIWLGQAPTRVFWCNEQMHAVSILLWPHHNANTRTSNGRYHTAQVFEVNWSDNGCTRAKATYYDVAGLTLDGDTKLHAEERFNLVLHSVQTCPKSARTDAMGRNIMREAEYYRWRLREMM